MKKVCLNDLIIPFCHSQIESNKIPVIIGITVGSVLLLLVIAIIIAAMIFFKRRKINSDKKDSISSKFLFLTLMS